MAFFISKTPHRISLFGGSTDYREFFEQYPSFVVGFAINQYSYITARKLPKFHTYKSKIAYSEVELVNDNSEIKHRIVNKVLETLQINYGVEIIHSADLPSGGVASSAGFTTGLLNVMQALEKSFTTPKGLAESAILLERNCLGEVTGEQDSYWAAYGGFNVIKFSKNETSVSPIISSVNFIDELEQSCLLIHTGVHKPQTNAAQACFGKKIDVPKLLAVREMAELGLKAIRNEDILEIGKLLAESWEIKKSLSPSVSNVKIDEICELVKYYGGFPKLCGSGGRGFILAIFPKEQRNKMLSVFKDLVVVPVKIAFEGSKIIYAER